jgi:hypothetical protein
MQQRQAIDFYLLGETRTSFFMLKHILYSFYLMVGVANVSVSGGADYPAVLRRHTPAMKLLGLSTQLILSLFLPQNFLLICKLCFFLISRKPVGTESTNE